MIPPRITAWLVWFGDRINPILVKETRQALKSRQFTGTFMLLLAASLVVSFGGVALIGPEIAYRASGGNFFVAYFAVLAFAIFVVVPFGAYRSLAAEQEERTFELLSITTLSPGQIVIGKLLSAIIQMFIYFSAIAPFMAFTYLLKGIDVLAIAFELVWALMGSVAFSMAGLLLATFSTRRSWQVLLSVVMITGLGLATIGSVPLAWELTGEIGGIMRDPEFWLAMAALVTAYVITFALVYQLSVSQLTFESDNRSSKVRIVLAIQFLTGLAWTGWTWIIAEPGDREVLYIAAFMGCFFWAITGSFLLAEPAGISRRVARQIPGNSVVRAFTGLFFPGPGTGLAFVLVHLLCIASLVAFAEFVEIWIAPVVGPNWRIRGTRGQATAVTFAAVSYTFFYLGLGALFVKLIRRFRPVPPVAGAAITAILAAFGSLIPNFFIMAMRPAHYQIYEFWQITDPGTTIDQIFTKPNILSPLVLVPVAMAGLVLLLNLPGMAREVCFLNAAGRQRLAPAQPTEKRADDAADVLPPVASRATEVISNPT